MGKVHLSNSKGRDAEIIARPVSQTTRFRWLDPNGRQVRNAKVMRGDFDHDLQRIAEGKTDDELIQSLIESDPEVDFENFGRMLNDAHRVYINERGEVVYRVVQTEVVRAPDGTEKARRPHRPAKPNVAAGTPIRWGRLMKKKDIFNKFVFSKKVQLTHVNGLTYDFLYGIAKELEEADSVMFVGAGPRGADPLVFQRDGLGYRGFLEGRTNGDRYMLILHLSNQELKAPEEMA
jgi:hypothetical protein